MAQYYKNLYQNWIEPISLKWDDVLIKVKNPYTYEDKNDIPLWSFYVLKPHTVDLWNGAQAIGANMQSVVALLVDFDDGDFTIEDAAKKFDFQFVAYASPSSTPEVQKFRMVVPLASAVPNIYFKVKAIRQLLCKRFAGCDESTFDYFRRQRMPGKLETTAYKFHVQQGDRLKLDVDYFEALYKQFKAENSQKVKATLSKESIFKQSKDELSTLEMVDSMKKTYSEELKALDTTNRGGGIVHDTFRRIVYALRKAGMPEDEVLQFMLAHINDCVQEIEGLVYSDIHD